MKNFIIILLLLTACSKSNDPAPVRKPQTDAAIIPYYNSFKEMAKARGVSTPVVVLQFGTCDCNKDGVWQVNSNADDLNLQFHVYHALGHAALNRLETAEYSIMNQSIVDDWKAKESVLMDELFK